MQICWYKSQAQGRKKCRKVRWVNIVCTPSQNLMGKPKFWEIEKGRGRITFRNLGNQLTGIFSRKEYRNSINYDEEITFKEKNKVGPKKYCFIPNIRHLAYHFGNSWHKIVKFWCRKCNTMSNDNSVSIFCCQNYFPRPNAHLRPCFALIWG